MIWATVSSWSCFCWLYRASPSLAAKNIINLISVLTIWWCPCVESSLVLLEEGVCYDTVCSLGKTLLAFALLHSLLQGQIRLSLQVFLDFLLLRRSVPASMDHTEAWLWGAIPRPRSVVVTKSSRLRQRRSGGWEELLHVQGQAGRPWEDTPRPR